MKEKTKQDATGKVAEGRHRLRTGIVTAVAIALLALVVAFYILRLNAEIDASTVSTMKEISHHDMGIITSTIENSLNELGHIGEKLRSRQYASIQELLEALNSERAGSTFKMLSLADTDGKVYSDNLSIMDGNHLPCVQQLLSGAARSATKHSECIGTADAREAMLTYSYRIDLQVEDAEFIGIIGATDIHNIEENFRVTSFGGSGATTIVDADGSYVVNQSAFTGMGGEENFFQNIAEYQLLSGSTHEDIGQRMQGREEFMFSASWRGQKYRISMVPLDFPDWYIVMRVPESVFRQQSRPIVLMTTAIMAVTILVLLIFGVLIYRSMRATVQARAIAESRTDFLNNMSHEIRTPLNGLIGLNYLIKQNLGNQEKVREYVEKSESTAQYLLSLINDILDMSKLAQYKMELVIEPFSLPQMVQELQSMLQESMNAGELDFKIHQDLNCPMVVGDVMRLKQVLINILGNAAKFTYKGGSVSLEVWQDGEESESVVTYFRIQDTGIGMSEEFQKHIFDAFSQEQNKAKKETSIKGTGLGMSISYMLMRQMGGDLTVASELGKGSCFTAILPAKASKASEPPKKQGPEEHRPSSPAKLSILVAEDNELNAEILLEILADEGFTTAWAKDGEQAVELFEASESGTFNLILMDAQMPLMDGYTAARTIRGLSRPDAKSVKIYACTANTGSENRERALASGMDGFITKPIDIGKLLQVLDQEHMADEDSGSLRNQLPAKKHDSSLPIS